MTEQLLHDVLIEAQKKGEIGLFIWKSWKAWDEFAFEMREGGPKYDFAISKVINQEEAILSIQLDGIDEHGILAVPTPKMIKSDDFFKHVFEICDKENYKGPITFIPSNEISQYC